MVILVDTNIILDVLQKREPFYKDSKMILAKCASGDIKGYIALHTVTNLFFILRKQYSIEDRRKLLLGITAFLKVTGVTHDKVREALSREEFKDFEDCLQDECADAISADYIVTRNISDFAKSKITAIEPEQFLKM